MSEMIERVAEALFSGGPRETRPAPNWLDLTANWRNAFRATARVAVQAMREPRGKMIKAMQQALLGDDNVAGPAVMKALTTDHFYDAWHAAIDEALREEFYVAFDEALDAARGEDKG